ncbi:nucleotide exchange factor GrpE [Amycolatopsis sp. K13G38]|uniref:Nucleotide exchange factor GrpE n=1 Tax=Amycolatopsis acididurans TaxID=2724524 RepID=A0ABX1JFV4_9PSEU|nr:nucleotide exchange factor GrpE [Amycolatopsis acididurans]
MTADDPTGQISAALIKEIDGTGTSEDDVKAVLDRALADRQALIQLCLYALDRARSGGVVERLEQGLASVGVTAVRPDGQRFDPSVHEAGGAVETDDPALDGTVAETEVAGFTDHDKLLRAPIVTVYQKR